MTKKISIIASFFVVCGIIAVAVLKYYYRAQAPTDDGSVPSSWTTYSNREYGFELRYPKTLTPEFSFSSYYHLPAGWRSGAVDPAAGTSVVAIPVYRITQETAYPRYFSAEVRVGFSRDAREVAQCFADDQSYRKNPPASVVLGGVSFKKFEINNAGMSQYLRGVSYRTIRDGACFVIDQLVTGSSYRDERSYPAIPDSQLDGYLAQAGVIAQTFRFVK